MKITPHRACYLLWVMLAILFLFLFDYFRLDIDGGQAQENYETLTKYEVEIKQDATAPTGIRTLYTFTLDDIDESYCELVFYCIHQNAKVYLEETCIYNMALQYTGISGKSPGYIWNCLSFLQEDNGKKVTIEITPVYSSSNDIVPLMYFGNKYDIARAIIMNALPDLFFCMVVIVVGVIYIFFVLYNNRKTTAEKDLSMLGFFSIQLGLWKIFESEAVNFLFAHHPLLAQIALMTLMFMTLSIVLYVKELFSTRNRLIWKIPCILCFANILLTLPLQYLGVVDMRQMLPFTHITIGLIVIITIIMTIYEIHFVGWNQKLKRNIRCLVLAFAGGGMDMLLYYTTHGSAPAVFTMIGFLIYILVLGISSMQEVKELMNFGIKAQEYEQLAYHDQLTGLYNRTAYEEYTNSKEFNPEDCIVLIMDLNNLKSCNDILGHDKGDIYIKVSAEMIKENFSDIGRCYRMGGDEFYVLVTNGSLITCRQRIAMLQEQVAMCTAVDNDFIMGIACGFQVYDGSLDSNISETARRADRAMYQDKFAMKR